MVPREKEVLRAVEPLTRAGVVRGTAIFLSYPAPRLRVHPRVLTGGKYRDTTFNSSTGGVGEPRSVSAEPALDRHAVGGERVKPGCLRVAAEHTIPRIQEQRCSRPAHHRGATTAAETARVGILFVVEVPREVRRSSCVPNRCYETLTS